MVRRSATLELPVHNIVTLAVIVLLTGCNSGDSDEAGEFTYPAPGHNSMQALINKAANGAIIFVKPGVYNETFQISNKKISIVGTGRNSVFDGAGATCVSILDGEGSLIEGLSLINCEDGILTDSQVEIRNNFFFRCKDAIDFEDGSGGVVADNAFYDQLDDAIDLDDGVKVEIFRNRIVNSADDGIEIRLQAYSGPEISVSISANLIHANKGNGIQFIDYEVDTSRSFFIERNIFSENEFNDISFSDNEITLPSLSAGTISESVTIRENIFQPKQQSFSGGGSNTILRDNSFYSVDPGGGLNLPPGFDSTDNVFVSIF